MNFKYIQIQSLKNAKWRLEFWKKHKKDLEGVQQYDLVSTFDLPAYYAYGNAKDIVEDKFKEIIDKSKDGWENEQRYLINDYENHMIKFTCKEIKVVSVNYKD